MKIGTGLFLFISFFVIFTSSIFAVSGCCSGKHGGVNCLAGSQTDGHVICNDGWLGSTCLYTSQEECTGVSVTQQQPMSTIIPSLFATSAPTLVPTSSPIPIITPQVQIVVTEIPKPTEVPTPTSTIKSLTAGETLGTFSVGFIPFAFIAWFVWKKLKNRL